MQTISVATASRRVVHAPPRAGVEVEGKAGVDAPNAGTEKRDEAGAILELAGAVPTAAGAPATAVEPG